MHDPQHIHGAYNSHNILFLIISSPFKEFFWTEIEGASATLLILTHVLQTLFISWHSYYDNFTTSTIVIFEIL